MSLPIILIISIMLLSIRCYRFSVFLLTLILFVIAGGSIDIPDYKGYEYMYQHIIPFPNQMYGFISDLFAKHNISYIYFRLAWASIALLCILYPIRKLLNYRQQSYFILIFIFTQFLIEVIQVRNFMVVALFSYSFYILLENKRFSHIKYFIIMLIATQIHQIAYMFLPLGFISLIKFRFTRNIIIFSVLLSMPIIFYQDLVVSIIHMFNNQFFVERLLVYFSHHRMHAGFLLPFTLHASLIFLLYQFYKALRSKTIYAIYNCKINLYRLFEWVLWSNIYLLIIWPLIAIDLNAFRFIRIMTPISLVTMIMGFEYIYGLRKITTYLHCSSYEFLLNYLLRLMCLFQHRPWKFIISCFWG